MFNNRGIEQQQEQQKLKLKQTFHLQTLTLLVLTIIPPPTMAPTIISFKSGAAHNEMLCLILLAQKHICERREIDRHTVSQLVDVSVRPSFIQC